MDHSTSNISRSNEKVVLSPRHSSSQFDLNSTSFSHHLSEVEKRPTATPISAREKQQPNIQTSIAELKRTSAERTHSGSAFDSTAALARFRSDLLQPFAQCLNRLQDPAENVSPSERVSSLRQISRSLNQSWMEIQGVVNNENSQKDSSLRTAAAATLHETAEQVRTLLGAAHTQQEHWACVYNMDFEAEAAKGAGSGKGGTWVAEYELMFCDENHQAAINSLVGLRSVRDTMVAAAASKLASATQTSSVFFSGSAHPTASPASTPQPPSVDSSQSNPPQDDSSSRLARLAAFRRAQPHLSRDFHHPPPNQDQTPYQLPWYYVDARCRVQRIDHAAEGARRNCPPPPPHWSCTADGNNNSQQQQHATVVTVPHALNMPRIDVSGHDRASARASQREAQKLKAMPPEQRVKAVKQAAQERRRAGERQMHLNLAVYVAHGRARPDHLKRSHPPPTFQEVGQPSRVLAQSDKMVHRVGAPLEPRSGTMATLETRVVPLPPQEELAENQPAYPPTSFALEKQLFRPSSSVPVF